MLSKLTYALPVYGPCLTAKAQRLIQRVQNACARFCVTIPPRSHVTPYLNNLNFLTMKGRQKLYLACLLFDVVNTAQPEYLYKKLLWRSNVNKQQIRSCTQELAIPQHRTASFRGSFKYSATKCWNDIPPPLKSLKLKSNFSRSYKTYLLTQQKSHEI